MEVYPNGTLPFGLVMPISNSLDRRSFLRLGVFAAISAPTLAHAAAVESSPLADLNERSLSFLNLHTSERVKTVYWERGEYIQPALAEIKRVLRDHRTGDEYDMDPTLLDLICDLRLRLDTVEPVQIISGYRSPATNAMLHAQSNGVATRSLHMDGKAADIRIPGRNLSLVRKTALAMKSGGVGYYPSSNFVHVDVGRVRSW